MKESFSGVLAVLADLWSNMTTAAAPTVLTAATTLATAVVALSRG